jgi:hypothetical protein
MTQISGRHVSVGRDREVGAVDVGPRVGNTEPRSLCRVVAGDLDAVADSIDAARANSRNGGSDADQTSFRSTAKRAR